MNKYYDFFRVKENTRVRNREGGSAAQYLCPVDTTSPEGLQFHPSGILFMKTFKEGFALADFRYEKYLNFFPFFIGN